ncbi:MAG: sigma-70 family RNA polymerase sigma factor [Ardenticatenaceae bacterium]|nr:sigma-70 family RNA polymerase sigma factor [Ardenticatenaceae bacterium]HBY93071.1 hypothetical protein [Chloroflexota bacterium]
MANAHDFDRVYQQALPAVWRFVAARVPDYQEAQDVTSEVFTRAWRSWEQYNPERGSSAAWLCGIAQRTVADWWRRQERRRIRWELRIPDGDATPVEGLFVGERRGEPDAVVLQKEDLAELRSALAHLNERERDALALRFAAGLRVAEIAAILDLSGGATKMMICRAILKLKAVLTRESSTPQRRSFEREERTADALEEAIAGILARRRTDIPDPVLERLIYSLAVIHRPPVPPELPNRVKACLGCVRAEQQRQASGRAGRLRAFLARFHPVSVYSLGTAMLAPVCSVCAGFPVLAGLAHPPAMAGGLVLLFALHKLLWVLVSLNVALLWQSFQRHRNPAGVAATALGALLILSHLGSHVFLEHADHGALAFIVSLAAIWAGSALLAAGVFLDWRARRLPVLSLRTSFPQRYNV